MYSFDTPISSIEPAKGRSAMPVGGYIVKIVGAEFAPNKKKDGTNFVLSVDVAEGPFTGYCAKYPKKVFMGVTTDAGKGIFRKTLDIIIHDNEGMISSDILNESTFDESVLIGLTCGAIFESDGKYLNVKYLCSKEYALSKAPKSEDPPSTDQSDLPF